MHDLTHVTAPFGGQAIKSGMDLAGRHYAHPAENIVVRNCHFVQNAMARARKGGGTKQSAGNFGCFRQLLHTDSCETMHPHGACVQLLHTDSCSTMHPMPMGCPCK